VRCPMEAREGAELVLAYCSRRLDPDKSEWFERHLEACVSCQETVAAQRQVWEALDYWDALPVPRDFDRRLEWRIEAEARKPWSQRLSGLSLTGWLRPAIPVASMAALALTVFLVRAPDPPDTDFQPRVEAAEVEQAESALEDLEMIRQFTLPPREANARNPI
jgi:anti-sigma factor RsiW